MPPRAVKKGSKRSRQYEHIKESQLEQGRSEERSEEIAARTVNKERARAGESDEFADLDPGHFFGTPRRGYARVRVVRAAGPEISSTARRGSSTSPVARA